MKFGKYLFKSFEEFQSIQNLAMANGIRTMKEFTEFLRLNCNQYLVKR
ncbi:hypothetical protein AAW29_01791 [Arcobacter porcinus]|nr:hypothetical protein AAW29_01791 [Arcobacter porcinus]OCL82318.1 hypothetical protein AAW30_01605 [Arcobacter porcinus]